jgi:hypothetical protein
MEALWRSYLLLIRNSILFKIKEYVERQVTLRVLNYRQTNEMCSITINRTIEIYYKRLFGFYLLL